PQAGTEADQPEHQGSGARRGSNRTGGTHKHRVESHPGRRDRGPAAPSEISRDREKPTFGSAEIDDKPPGSFRKKSARGCMFMGNKQIKEIRFGKLGGSQSLFLSSRGARPFF